MAMLLHILGALLNPLQELLASHGTTKVPLFKELIGTVTDIYALIDPIYIGSPDSGSTTAALRSTLANARESDTYQNLWPGNATCSSPPLFNCQRASSNDQNVIGLIDSRPTQDFFMSPVIANTSTGMTRQFAPRLNSSLTWDALSPDQFPSNCSGIAFFKNYTAKQITTNAYSISVCMMGDLTHTPFAPTRNRQDFNETLFVTADAWQGRKNTTFRLTLSTTAGYFELPNDFNNNTAGPLLEMDPFNCTSQCISQNPMGQRTDISTKPMNGSEDGICYLNLVPTKGPLALITLAIFGEDAFIDPNSHQTRSKLNSSNAAAKFCYEYLPLAFFFHVSTSCDGDSFLRNGQEWVNAFTHPGTAIPVLNQAAFLANQAIFEVEPIMSSVLSIHNLPSLLVARPEISNSVMIGLSVLIAVYLFMLTCLCVVNITQVPWADSLNGHAISRMTAALCSSLYSDMDQRLTQKTDDTLDKLPGYVGDAEPDAPIGRLAVGAEALCDGEDDTGREAD